ncbi:DENN domain-containing protein like [Verticillium longisporum]|uniref:DENN domain-containing protein like n=1 Tax=Verticillium longisporum TaxID=100787 RepID=A0A8I2ZUW8_VERLO|nr:DENN domain-containing protein like [Verticillium longisporum]
MDSSSTTPLADYFWIAGIETIAYDDPLPSGSQVAASIAEDGEQQPEENGVNPNGTGTPRHHARHSRQNSANRLSNSRFSIHTLDEIDGNTQSNRSSVTIRPAHAQGNGLPNEGVGPAPGIGLLDGFDFDDALVKFAAERENFLDDLTFSAGAKLQARPPMVNPRAERIKAEDGDQSGRRSPLRNLERSIKGSIRRKMSFRDMNSSRRQPVTPRASTPGAGAIPRQGSIRTTRRLSNYNSVIPPPEPLNTDPNMHPLKRRFEPVLLDRYPAKDVPEETARRGKFPDYVPMFAFPNDIQIVSSDDRPRSTWHGFTMTSDDNSKIYGITIIIWTALTSDVAEQVEKRCEQWRQRHMSNEERELAASLGVRLAAERANLSSLLARLPSVPSGSSARDALDDQISTVEEKISLMTEMLRPLRHGAASKIDGLTAGESGLWSPRAIFIPVLPARLLSALEAPCPYIVGVERRYERIELPEDDYVLVDLDKDTIDATSQPVRLPRQHRRKLHALLQVAAPAKLRHGVATGPPPYAMESFPYDAFSAENPSLYIDHTSPSTLAQWVAQNSSTFGEPSPASEVKPPIFNAFLHSKVDPNKPDRPGTSKSTRTSPPSSVSPVSINFPPMPTTPVSRSDSGFALTSTLREKRSRNFDEKTRRSSSFGVDKHGPLHRPSIPFLNGNGHAPSMSISAISVDSQPYTQSSYGGGYAPSTYAQSTLAASTIMPNMLIQPVFNTETTVWVEGHCFNWEEGELSSSCSVCDDRAEGDGIYKCAGCSAFAHGRCLGCVSLACHQSFYPDRVRAAFVRCLASLLYTYRKHLGRPSKDQKNNGRMYAFDMDGFIKSLPYDQQEYANMMRETQAFNEFIHERETKPGTTASIRFFDEIIMAKKARGRPGIVSGLSRLSTIRSSHGASSNSSAFSPPSRLKIPTYLSDTSDHMWRTASVPVPSAKFPGCAAA